MEIKYLKKLQSIKKVRGKENKGYTIGEIVTLETKYNNSEPFPLSYREYLFIGGRYSGVNLDEAFGLDWLQTKSKEVLKENNQKIERPFFVIDQLDTCEQFGFFYLDEEDEDPIIYNCMPPYVEDGYPLIQPYRQGRLSEVINSLIDSAESRFKYR